MIPYKPKANPYPYEHPLAGGTFPQPPALAQLCSQLPPPICFRGPFVAIDSLIDVFNRIKLPESTIRNHIESYSEIFTKFYFSFTDSPVPNAADNGCDVKLFDLAKSVHWIVEDSAYSGDGLKRKMLPGNDDSDDENSTTRPPPAQDIYRLRQQKRFK